MNKKLILFTMGIMVLATTHIFAQNDGQDAMLATLKKVVAENQDIHARNEQGTTYLFDSIEKGYVECVKFLLEHGAHANQVDMLGRSPLFVALEAKKERADDSENTQIAEEIMQLLLKHGATYDIFAAILSQNPEHVKKCIESKCDVKSQKIFFSLTPLFFAGIMRMQESSAATKQSCTFIADMLIKAGARHDIFTAVMFENVDMVKNILSKGDKVNRTFMEGDEPLTPLIAAITTGNVEIVSLLLSAGANVDTVSRDDQRKINAVYEATKSGNAKVLQLVIDAGADVHRGDEFMEDTPLLLASALQPQLVEVLIKAGANVNVSPEINRSPLHVAVEHNQLGAVKALAEAGADLRYACPTQFIYENSNSTTQSSYQPHPKTALEAAEEKGFTQIADYLKKKTGK